MRVKNVNGTSQNACACGSWLRHWVNLSRNPVPKYCSEKNCLEQPAVGAHVQKEDLLDNSWYIVPLCPSHNNLKGGALDVGAVTLVSANVSQTCARR